MNDLFLDRNLLLGTLALQMDFVDRDQLVNAMNAWVLDKSQRLEEVLLNQNALADDTCQLLVAMIDKHLQMDSADPRRTLASMVDSELRHTLSSITDADVVATLTQVSEASVPDATRSMELPREQIPGERYQALRLHASGGLGEVWVARDTELNREVALKEIKPRHAGDPNSRARFVTEAEVTGRLEHPCVVPVYGMGQHSDGRPYYAMRFIKGESFAEAIRRMHSGSSQRANEVEMRKLLHRFLDVCNAMEYAHSRGVLHRDIKPSNIMLGRYGETSVVDWGLAKYVGRDEVHRDPTETALVPGDSGDYAKTAMGSAVGTIQYMSPEQAAGSSDIVGPQSDIYSLGATLYTLLCGQPPIAPSGTTENLDSLRRRVNLGDYPRPRQVHSRVPAPLEAICLKAMSVSPENRYPSARDLAADIEAWMADEPVLAWHEPFRLRAGRWLRRHRALATGAAVAAIVALVSLLIGVVFLSASRERERLARQQAVHNFQLARDAVDQYLTKVSQDDRLRGSCAGEPQA